MSFYKDYFENIARKQASIRHEENNKECFFYIEDWNNTQPIAQKLARQAGNAILVLEEYDDEVNDSNADNNRVSIYGAFVVIKHVSDSRGDKDTAKEDCRRIAKSIVHKLKWDALNGVLNTQKIVCKMDSRGFSVGPVFNNYWGWRYSFAWTAPENIALNPADWLP